jgi:hypothetical protein
MSVLEASLQPLHGFWHPSAKGLYRFLQQPPGNLVVSHPFSLLIRTFLPDHFISSFAKVYTKQDTRSKRV